MAGCLRGPAMRFSGRFADDGRRRIVPPFHGNGVTIGLSILAAFVRRQTIPSGCKMLWPDRMRVIPDKACGASPHEPAGLAFQGVFLSF
ncbi:MAG: hypothetical protein ACTHOP_09000 [Mesorhizobium sp.]